MKVYEILSASAETWPDGDALVDQSGSWNYAQLWSQVQKMRMDLEEQGLEPGMAIGVRGHNSRAFLVAAFAASAIGGVVVTLPPELEDIELNQIKEDLDFSAVLDDGDVAETIEGRHIEVSLEQAMPLRLICNNEGKRGRGHRFASHVPDAAFIRFTSGTTGRAKGVILSHSDIDERTRTAQIGLNFCPKERVLWVLPMAFHFFVSIVMYLRSGSTILLPPEHSAPALLEFANRHRATFLYASPEMVEALASEKSAKKFDHLERAISTSTGLAEATAENFYRRFGLPIAQAYGIIEVGLPLCNLESAMERPRTVGRVLPGYELALLDEKDIEIECPQAQGQLAVRGPGLFSAYLFPPRLRKETLTDQGWFPTGDLACRDEENTYTILGRCSSAVQLGNIRLMPEQVEESLNLHPLVAASRVIGQQAKDGKEVFLKAQIVSQQADMVPTEEELRRWCEDRLDKALNPREFEFVSQIPLTASGKVMRH